MKWVIWTPAIVIVLSAFTIPGGLVLFGLPLLALGYLVVAVIALAGSADDRAASRVSTRREQREPASSPSTETSSDESGIGAEPVVLGGTRL